VTADRAELRNAEAARGRLARLCAGDCTPAQQALALLLVRLPGATVEQIRGLPGLGDRSASGLRHLLYDVRAALGLRALQPGPSVPVGLLDPEALAAFMASAEIKTSGVFARSPEGVIVSASWAHPVPGWQYGVVALNAPDRWRPFGWQDAARRYHRRLMAAHAIEAEVEAGAEAAPAEGPNAGTGPGQLWPFVFRVTLPLGFGQPGDIYSAHAENDGADGLRVKVTVIPAPEPGAPEAGAPEPVQP